MSYPEPISGRSTVTLNQCLHNIAHGFYTGSFCPSCMADKHQEILARLDECTNMLRDVLAKIDVLENKK